jgi:ribosomal protein S18 acetylase RimI-like enzyme
MCGCADFKKYPHICISHMRDIFAHPHIIMVTIKKVETSELDTLLQYSKKTFYEFFSHLNDPLHFEAYVAVAFTPEKMLSELADPNSEFYFAVIEDDIAGYIKLNFNSTQNEFKDENGLEVERIYVSGEHHGKHIGRQLLNFAIERGIQLQKDFIWLGVWEHNQKAIGFYRAHGFEVCGSHDFILGEDRQTDLLMKKYLNTI